MSSAGSFDLLIKFSCIGLLLSASQLCSCRNGIETDDISKVEVEQRLTEANKVLVQKERKEIQNFISRHHFNMDSTGTGLRYSIYTKGNGETPKPHDAVVLAYKVWYLSGEQVYDVNGSDPDTARLSEGQLINGIEEALYKMPEGSKARLVIPAHLAYGMIGDEKKIPGATPLYYDLQLLRINP
ncbi:MAG: FKBP-type peptidyl-prolyl cis-trans isomerase [Bacteroidota bacterium]